MAGKNNDDIWTAAFESTQVLNSVSDFSRLVADASNDLKNSSLDTAWIFNTELSHGTLDIAEKNTLQKYDKNYKNDNASFQQIVDVCLYELVIEY